MDQPRHPYLDGPAPIVMAHRGFSPAGLENSMAAFAAAVDLGVRYLETDVRATRDGVLVAFHDARLDRVTDGHGALHALPWAQVRRARIRGTEPIPLLEDVVAAWPDVRLNVDVKSRDAVLPLAQVIRRTRCQDRLLIGSFSDRRRRAVLSALSDLGPLAWSPGVPELFAVLAARRGADAMRRALRGAACLQVPERLGRVRIVTPALLGAVHQAGAQVHVWTVNDPADMARLLDDGVDGLITDRADLAMALLRRRANPSREDQP